MDKAKNIELIFEEWSASFRSKDKKMDAVRGNFQELFQKWSDVGATRDDLHDMYLLKAITVHLPSRQTVKHLYKQQGHLQNKSEKEFADGWNKAIKDVATEAFFEYFPVSVESDRKVYGNLGREEYNHQRRLSSQFPILDTTELEKRLHERNDDLDLEDLKIALLGNGGKKNE